jgi:TRAP-type mannitol/chloroaromatic compound transport system permease small subunit
MERVFACVDRLNELLSRLVSWLLVALVWTYAVLKSPDKMGLR